MKDVPTETPAGLAFPALTKREDPRDCLISAKGLTLESLPPGARIGTSSLRRQAQLRHHRAGLASARSARQRGHALAKSGRGRIRRHRSRARGRHATGRARQSLRNYSARISCCPPWGRALWESRRAKMIEDTARLVAALNDPETRACVTAERALLHELEGGCQVPLGAWARLENGVLQLEACLFSPDGKECLRGESIGEIDDAEEIGKRLGKILRDAARNASWAWRALRRRKSLRMILKNAIGTDMDKSTQPLAGKRIVVTRAPEQSGEIDQLARKNGRRSSVSADGGIRRSGKLGIARCGAGPPRRIRLDFIHQPECGAILRSAAARAWQKHGFVLWQQPAMSPSWARQPQQAAVREGFHVDLRGPKSAPANRSPASLRRRFAATALLLPRSDRADDRLPNALRQAGARVTEVVAYRTAAPEKVDAAVLGQLRRGEVDAIVFASPSAFHNLCDLIPAADLCQASRSACNSPPSDPRRRARCANRASAWKSKRTNRPPRRLPMPSPSIISATPHGARPRMTFPVHRPRRLRRTEALRGFVRETHLSARTASSIPCSPARERMSALK